MPARIYTRRSGHARAGAWVGSLAGIAAMLATVLAFGEKGEAVEPAIAGNALLLAKPPERHR